MRERRATGPVNTIRVIPYLYHADDHVVSSINPNLSLGTSQVKLRVPAPMSSVLNTALFLFLYSNLKCESSLMIIVVSYTTVINV